MLVLPIRPREGAAAPQDAQNEGEQVPKRKNWSPSTTSTAEGNSAVHSSHSDELKVTVKNTFIDVESPEATRVDLHSGAQSCTARIDNRGSHSFMHSPSIPEAEVEHEDASGDHDPTRRRLCYDDALSSPDSRNDDCSRDCHALSEDTQLPVGSSSGRLSPTSATSIRSRAASSLGTPVPAPPSYAAPALFNEDAPTAPPPLAPPGHSSSHRLSELESTPEHFAVGAAQSETRVVVKNTFIEFEQDEQTPLANDRTAMSCVARFSEPARFPSMASPAVKGTRSAGGRFATDGYEASARSPFAPLQQAADAVAPGQVSPHGGMAEAPSQGSRYHGINDPDGLPQCQPCAWFYKDSGCLNGLGCRYCHLCPQGELKNRKKQKIQRLRAQEAAEAEAAGESSPQSQAGSKAAKEPKEPAQAQAIAAGGKISLSALLG